MPLTRRFRLVALTLLAITTTAVSSYAAMKPENAIVARRAVMRMIQLNMDMIGPMVKGDVPFDAAEFRASAERMASASTMPLKSYFLEGTDVDIGDVKTRAMPELWLDWENFETKLENMRKEVDKLAEVSRGSDESAMRDQAGKVAKGCKDCHDTFRNK